VARPANKSRLNADAVRWAAQNKWGSILAAAGIDKAFLTKKQGPCPICQDGEDRFVFDDKDGRGSYICRVCGPGDGFNLLQRVKGIGFSEALRLVAELSGEARPVAVTSGPNPEEVRKEVRAIWGRSLPLSEVPAAAAWWLKRLGEIPQTTELRAVHALKCGVDGVHPAMVARIKDAAGNSVSLHRTYLSQDGEKAPVETPRRLMALSLPDGSAVRLYPDGDVLGVAEGIETAESCRVLFGTPTWALLNAVNMKGFVPPPSVRRVIVYGDLDASFTGQAAAFDLAKRLTAKRKDWSPALEVQVSICGVTIDPSAWDRDWNDVLLAKRAASTKAPERVV
jgi:putative DNA primase/helicase